VARSRGWKMQSPSVVRKMLRSGLRAMNRCLRPCGFEITRLPQPGSPPPPSVWYSSGANLPHSDVRPFATYSPWLCDVEFLAIRKAIENHTLIDIFRCYELWELGKQTVSLPGAILEVGVWRGGSGCLLAAAAPQKTVYLADTFAGVVKAGAKDTRYRGGEHADTSDKTVRALLEQNNVSNAVILKGIFPEETAHDIPQDICLVHVDVDVYQSGRDVVTWSMPRLVKGAAIVFDDYGFEGCDGITRLVHELQVELPDFRFIQNLNGHAILIRSA
jgi:O-methyltransferase